MNIDLSKPWQIVECTEKEFLLAMAAIGPYQDINLVLSYADPNDQTKRTAWRDIPLPPHRDGLASRAIRELQGGFYIEKLDEDGNCLVDVVGMYCLQDNRTKYQHLPCYTILYAEGDEAGEHEVFRHDLLPGQALIWDNRLWHGREGDVGNRVLLRFWSTCLQVRERPLVMP